MTVVPLVFYDPGRLYLDLAMSCAADSYVWFSPRISGDMIMACFPPLKGLHASYAAKAKWRVAPSNDTLDGDIPGTVAALYGVNAAIEHETYARQAIRDMKRYPGHYEVSFGGEYAQGLSDDIIRLIERSDVERVRFLKIPPGMPCELFSHYASDRFVGGVVLCDRGGHDFVWSRSGGRIFDETLGLVNRGIRGHIGFVSAYVRMSPKGVAVERIYTRPTPAIREIAARTRLYASMLRQLALGEDFAYPRFKRAKVRSQAVQYVIKQGYFAPGLDK